MPYPIILIVLRCLNAKVLKKVAKTYKILNNATSLLFLR
nr:MAG TPA: hypothetical protein [Crassvirales sp.]